MTENTVKNSQIISQAKLYVYFHSFLSSKIDPLLTKKVFLLAIYDFLADKISFENLGYIVYELGFHLNNFFDLSKRDHQLAMILLDLDETTDQEVITEKEINEWKQKLRKYYENNLPTDFSEKEINK